MNNTISGKIQIALYLYLLSLYIITMKGVCTGDNVFHYDRVQNIVKEGNLSMPKEKYDFDKQPWLRVFMAKGKTGEVYLTLGDGLSIAAVPFGLVGNIIEKLVDVSLLQTKMEEAKQEGNVAEMIYYLRKLPSAFFSALINPVIMALTVLIFFNFCLRITNSITKAFLASILLGNSTIIWVYSSTFWTQPIVTFCLFCAFYFIFLFRKNHSNLFLLLAGILLGYSFITRYVSIITVPFFTLYIICSFWRMKRKMLLSLALFALPLVFFFLLQMGWNFYRFDSIFNMGAKHQAFLRFSFRGKLYVSLPAMLVGFNRSIFVFSPPLILFLFSVKKFIRKHRLEALTLFGVVLVYLLFYSKFSFWSAPASWGPRFLVPIKPFLLLPACVFIGRIPWKKILVYALLIIGLFVQLVGVLLPLQTTAIEKYFGGIPKTSDFFLKSEIIPQAKLLFTGNIELWFLDSLPKLIIGLVLILICCTSIWYCDIIITRSNREE